MKIFAIAGSLRAGSFNRQLVKLAAEAARAQGAETEVGNFPDYCPPHYDADVEAANGLPPETLALITKIESADGLIIATPEYNRSVPGPLKNALDWLSRSKPYKLQGKPMLLIGATSGKTAVVNGIAALRNTLDFQGARLHADSFGLSHSAQAFTADGRLSDAAMADKLGGLVKAFLDTIAVEAAS